MDREIPERKLFESERYIIRLPITDAEIIALEEILFECRVFGNPVVRLYGYSPSTGRIMFNGTRKF